jgi:transposase
VSPPHSRIACRGIPIFTPILADRAVWE